MGSHHSKCHYCSSSKVELGKCDVCKHYYCDSCAAIYTTTCVTGHGTVFGEVIMCGSCYPQKT